MRRIYRFNKSLFLILDLLDNFNRNTNEIDNIIQPKTHRKENGENCFMLMASSSLIALDCSLEEESSSMRARNDQNNINNLESKSCSNLGIIFI